MEIQGKQFPHTKAVHYQVAISPAHKSESLAIITGLHNHLPKNRRLTTEWTFSAQTDRHRSAAFLLSESHIIGCTFKAAGQLFPSENRNELHAQLALPRMD